MSHRVVRLAALITIAVVLVIVGGMQTKVAHADPLLPLLPQQMPTQVPREGPIPCDPVWSREIEPRIIEEGGQVTVKVTYNFKCSGDVRQINYFIVIENSAMLRQGAGGREALDNVVKGARKFVNQVEYANGSQGGLVLYAAQRQIRVPLGGGEQNRKNMLTALGNIPLPPIGNSNGAGAAIRDATGLLPTQQEESGLNVLIIIDAGAPEVPGEGPPIIDRFTACNAARQSGVLVTVLGFPEGRGRMISCATRGWYFSVSDQRGRNVPEIFDDLSEAILRGREMKRVDYSDWPYPGVDYVEGSGYPRDYDYEVIGEYTWEFEGKEAPPTGQRLEYNLEIDPVTYPGSQVIKVSNDATMSFVYSTGDPMDVEMDNPEICIYKPSEKLFCDDWAMRNLTPTPGVSPTSVPPTDTPQPPTPTPTIGHPTETPASPTAPPEDTVTPTPSVGTSIFLPAAYNKAG
jgi:hypothetical protein